MTTTKLNTYFIEVEDIAERDVIVVEYVLDVFEVLVDNCEVELLCTLWIKSRRSEKSAVRILSNEMFHPVS